MDRQLICQICGEKLPFDPICTCALGDHLIKHHPDAEMTHFLLEDMSPCDCVGKKSSEGDASEDHHYPRKGSDRISRNTNNMNRNQYMDGPRDTDSNIDSSSYAAFGSNQTKKPVFKTTVETWKAGPMKVACPLCREKDRPCIRKQRNKVAYTQWGALFMVSCWPICFLPFLMPQSSEIYVYCRHCGTLLGEYDRQTGTLKPFPIDPSKKINVPHNLC